jgi:BlaI family transcriptional regulator, penicillinase repressor
MGREVRISDAEWDVMEVVWKSGSATAADVIEALAGRRGWNHSTIRTMLARLVEKGALRYEVDGPRYIYRAAVTRKRCVRDESRSFLERVFGGDVGSLLVHYVRESRVEPKDLEALRRLLDEKLKGKE